MNNDLTPNKVVISHADGKVSTSSVSSTEVGHLAGTTDLIQNQLNSKAPQLTTYTKSEVDQLVDNNLLLKADKSFSVNESAVGDITCNSLTVGTPSIHNLTNTAVTFGTPVTCQYDLSCGTLASSSIYGGASIQIQQNIDTAIVAAALSAQLPLSININLLRIDLSSYATTSSTYTTTVIDDK